MSFTFISSLIQMENRKDITFLSFAPNVPADDYWSHTFIKDILEDIPDTGDRHIFVIPGEYQNPFVKLINQELSKYEKVLVIITSDEQNVFNTSRLSHKDMIIYSHFPTKKKNFNIDKWIPLGYTPWCREYNKEIGNTEKSIDWFFAGQITHKSRRKLIEQLRNLNKIGELLETEGFAQGMDHLEFTKKMNMAKVIPCPRGAVSFESFRMYEALEAGCIPVPEDLEMMNMLFPNSPLTVLDSWDNVNDYISNFSERYPELNNKVFAWWQLEKRNLKHRIMHDLGTKSNHTTVLIPTSPIQSHPDTYLIEKTIEDVRSRIDCEILIMIDGVREEQSYLIPQYNEYIRRLLWKCNYEWKNVTPILFNSHHHQAAMARETMQLVDTPTILYVEHDAPLTPDMDYDWDGIFNLIESGKFNIIRFHFESRIPEEHKYMMLDKSVDVVDGVPLIRTAQWSQRPHVASSEYYRFILNTYFTPESRTMIEDKMHGIVVEDFNKAGRVGWNNHKIAIYAPGENIKRSYHLDGRGNEAKYEMKF